MRGRILFNGNIGAGLMERARPLLGGEPRVLLVTAAWGANEYHEASVKAALNAVGVPSRFEGGHDQHITNLCVWHAWHDYLQKHPDVAAVQAELTEVGDAIRSFYLQRTAFHATQLRQAVRAARQRIPHFALGKLSPRDPLRPEATLSSQELLERAISRELIGAIASMVADDDRMLESLAEADEQLAARTGLHFDPDWRATRARLEARILSADVLFFFGGSPDTLLQSLRFFDLRPALLEALRRGATFITSSAGSLVMCERVILYNEFSGDPLRRDFHLHAQGLGLVGGIQVLPHCMDRIQTDDPDNLAYLARRFSTRVCAGLNEESFLFVELEHSRATSVGAHDGVYVFGPDGIKWCYRQGEALELN